ncbi:uncharacterized protein si:dkeyp-117h8.4 isoform X2 [Corythoichthys intestinalis]|uniref:uncharacterized protein si:dkeyp-117h8.4 isoform X2 n=1 Tax=Corythoichthys intestinalis TaxID=161448 RepID=UPI0025A5D849|nr:uncharacterized protein si:dkeyp-117h8.4 isoform X2 [Corythoichthys intestinalis]
MDVSTASLYEKIKHKLSSNALDYRNSLSRVIDKYSKTQNQDDAIDVDLRSIPSKALVHYMSLSKKHIEEKEPESMFDSRDDLLQSHNSSSDSQAQQLDKMQQDGGGDESHVSSQMLSEEGLSNVCSPESLLEDSRRNFSQIDVLPEDEDEELEMNLRSQGTTLSELYPSMINQIGRFQHWLHVSRMTDSVARKYRKCRQMSRRGNRIINVTRNHRRTMSSKAKMRKQTIPVLSLPWIPESPKPKWIELNSTFTAEIKPSFFALSPSQASSASLETLSDPSSKQPSVCNLARSQSPLSSSESFFDMMQRSRGLMGELLSWTFLSPSQSPPMSSDASSGDFLDLPPSSRDTGLSAARDKQASCVLRPLQSSDPASGASMNLPSRSKRHSLSAATEQPFLWTPSPSCSSSASSDQSLMSKRLFSTADVEHVSSGILSPSQADQPQKSKLLFNATVEDQPSTRNLSQPSSPSLDHYLRSKRLALSAVRKQQQPFSWDHSPSQVSGSPSGLSLRAKRLLNAAAEEQSSTCELSPSRPSSLFMDHSPRSKRIALSAAIEQQQPSLSVLSPSRDTGTTSDLSLRYKRLLNTAAKEQASVCRLSPLRSTCPSNLSQSSKKLFPSADVAWEDTRFEERPDVCGSPVIQSPSKMGMANWEGLRRSPFTQNPNSGHFRSAASPLQKLLTPQKLKSKSCVRCPPKAHSKLWRPLSSNSSLASDSNTHSYKDLDDEFNKYYNKFVCQSKLFNGHRCRMCAWNGEGCLQHSRSLVALALSPHSFGLRKRHQEINLENPGCSKHWGAYSPGSKRHRNEGLRRRLQMTDAQDPRGEVYNHRRYQWISDHPLLEDATQTLQRKPYQI